MYSINKMRPRTLLCRTQYIYEFYILNRYAMKHMLFIIIAYHTINQNKYTKVYKPALYL